MFILGDVLVIVSLIVGICTTGWALILACGLLFPHRSESATDVLTAHPLKCIGRGTLVTVLMGGLAIVMLSGPNPIGKFAGIGVLLALLAVAVLGASGMSRVVAARIEFLAPGISPFGAYCRAAGFLVVGSMMPFLGWFLFAPVAILASVGSGWPVLLRRASRPSLAETLTL